MKIIKHFDAFEKLTQMGDVTLYEPAGDLPAGERKKAEPAGRERRQAMNWSDCITSVTTPRGPKPVLKTMLTTACERNCYYCPFRAGRGAMRRMTFGPDELAKAFDTMQGRGQVDGLFLSSGIIKGGVTTQDKLLDTVEIIRQKYRYRGYIHLKIMPGAEADQVYRALQLADRISINLEGPTPQRLKALAPKKDLDTELLTRLVWAGQMRQQVKAERPYEKLASLATQFVVGAVGDTDLELLSMTERLYQQTGLARIYYSAFSPVVATPFEELAPTPALREHRLYQASFLLRDYKWDAEELPFIENGNLALDIDPKRAWADHHLAQAPVDVQRADESMLLRVPGFGPKSVAAIIRARQHGLLRDLSDLRALGVRAPQQSAPYILLDGRRPEQQMRLF